MKIKEYKKIPPIKRPTKIEGILTKGEYEYLSRALREVIFANYDEIIKGVHFTEEELSRLEIVKSRRIYENHYERW